jgi:hypothetical protein
MTSEIRTTQLCVRAPLKTLNLVLIPSTWEDGASRLEFEGCEICEVCLIYLDEFGGGDLSLENAVRYTTAEVLLIIESVVEEQYGLTCLLLQRMSADSKGVKYKWIGVGYLEAAQDNGVVE